MKPHYVPVPVLNCYQTASYCMKFSVLSISSVPGFLFNALHYSLDIGIRHCSEICGPAPTFQLMPSMYLFSLLPKEKQIIACNI